MCRAPAFSLCCDVCDVCDLWLCFLLVVAHFASATLKMEKKLSSDALNVCFALLQFICLFYFYHLYRPINLYDRRGIRFIFIWEKSVLVLLKANPNGIWSDFYATINSSLIRKTIIYPISICTNAAIQVHAAHILKHEKHYNISRTCKKPRKLK